MSHANAALTPKARLELGRLVVDRGWTVSQAADYYRVSWPTANRWALRYRELREGSDQPVTSVMMGDRSSRPARSPSKTSEPLKRKIVHLRWKKAMGPVQIAGKLGIPASTVLGRLCDRPQCRSHTRRRKPATTTSSRANGMARPSWVCSRTNPSSPNFGLPA